MSHSLSGLNRYPVKSCQGQPLRAATVLRWGLDGDRRWMLVDDEGETVTAREHPRLVLVRARPAGDGGLDVTGPDGPTLHVPPATGELRDVRVHSTPVLGRVATPEANAFFSAVTGIATTLVHLDDPTRRRPNPRFSAPDDRVGYADAYPLLATTEASLAALNDLVAERTHGAVGPLPMTRFRPNLVIAGGRAWEEDGWRRVRIGDAVFRAVKGCDRCVLTTVDPVMAERGHEPIATLARHRKWDGKTWFGMNLVPDTIGVEVSVSDEVEILEWVDAPDGPPR